ncbi:unnamed protein product [Rhodiola kirilowii]
MTKRAKMEFLTLKVDYKSELAMLRQYSDQATTKSRGLVSTKIKNTSEMPSRNSSPFDINQEATKEVTKGQPKTNQSHMPTDGFWGKDLNPLKLPPSTSPPAAHPSTTPLLPHGRRLMAFPPCPAAF